jgi:hypothetical protein
MAKRRAPKGPETLYDKVKKFDEELATRVTVLTDDELTKKLTTFADEDDRVEGAREQDTDLAHIRTELKTANETYTVPLKRNKLRRKLVLQTLKERGKL